MATFSKNGWGNSTTNLLLKAERLHSSLITAPAHPRIDNLQAVELIFLPPNTISKTQSMNQGVIRSLKAHYRAKSVKRYIASIDAKKGIPSINILNAMPLLVDAWDRVTAATITNCFRKAGISTENQQQSLDDVDDPFQALASETEELRARDEALIPSEITADEYIDTDDSLFTFETCAIKDDEILSKVTSIEEDQEDGEDTDEIEDHIQPSTKYEVMQDLEVLQTCTFYDADAGYEMPVKVNVFSKLYDISMTKAKRQKAITDFFVHNEHKL